MLAIFNEENISFAGFEPTITSLTFVNRPGDLWLGFIPLIFVSSYNQVANFLAKGTENFFLEHWSGFWHWIGLFFRTVTQFWIEWTDRTSVLFISVREGPEVPTRGARTVEEEEIVKPGKISERILNLLLAKRSYYWPFRYFCSVLIWINSCSDPLF